MRVTLRDITTHPEEKIAEMAAICYDADTSPGANERRVRKLMNLRHLAVLRFASATFKVEEISRICSHQIVRHPHLSYLQRSQRYCKEGGTGFVVPESVKSLNLEGDYLLAVEDAADAYAGLLAKGVRKEDARFVLPQAAHTEMYITGNFQAWFDFLVRRLDPHAQWEIRAVAKEIYSTLAHAAPNVFNDKTLGV